MIYQKKLKIIMFSIIMLVSTLAFSELPNGEELNGNTYYTFHNGLGGYVLTNSEAGCDFMDEYFPGYVYDGKREWYVVRTGLGFYSKFVSDKLDGAALYTNSFWVKLALHFTDVTSNKGWLCKMLDVQE